MVKSPIERVNTQLSLIYRVGSKASVAGVCHVRLGPQGGLLVNSALLKAIGGHMVGDGL